MRVATIGTLFVALVALLGCSGRECQSAASDCTSQIRIGDRVYSAYGFAEIEATRFGKAEHAECHDSGCDPQGSVFPSDPTQVTVYSFDGYQTDQVVGARLDDESFMVYVSEALPVREAERLLRELSRGKP